MLKRVFASSFALVLLAGCADRSLYHYHRTVVGVDIAGSVDGETPRGHVIVGYSRRLVVVVPPAWELETPESLQKKQQLLAAGQAPTQPTTEDVPSTVFCTQVKASLGGVSIFREVMATGNPATRYAEYLVANSPAGLHVSAKNAVCPDLEVPQKTGTTGKPASQEQAAPSGGTR